MSTDEGGAGSPRSPEPEPVDVPPVAGERTWTIYYCPECGHAYEDGGVCSGMDPWHDDVEVEEVEVVELSRLRAAEEERDIALASVVSPEEHYEALAERDRLAEALRRLVRLKDGPRGAAYEKQKPRAWAWSFAREALASLEGGNDG